MKRKSIVILLIAVLVVGGMVFYRINKNKEKAAAQQGPRGGNSSVKVYGTVVQGQPFSDFLSLSGAIEADEQIELHTEISGI